MSLSHPQIYMVLFALQEFAHFLDEFVLCPISIAVVLVGNVAFAIDDDGIWNHLDAKSALELAVRIEKHFVGPSVVVDKRLHLVDVLSLVDRHGDDFYACLLLPFLIDIGYG